MIEKNKHLPISLTLKNDNTRSLLERSFGEAEITINTAITELSDEQKKQIEAFAQRIDLTDSSQILNYGFQAQKKIADFSEEALKKIIAKDIGEIGEVLAGLSVQIRDFSATLEPSKGFKAILSFFNKGVNQLKVLRNQYATVESNLLQIVDALEGHKIQLLKDVAMMDKMYALNLEFYQELTMYIAAGKKRLQYAEEVELPELRSKAEIDATAQSARTLKDFEDICNRFDKKLHDLDLTRTICMQMAPQIRITQNNDSMMVEKIQTSLINTIPLWKNSMVIALGLTNAKKAVDAQRAVSQLTNDLLRKNADMLRESSAEVIKEAERSIIDIETVKHINQQLISTIDEVLNAQENSRKSRRDAEKELQNIEVELKNKLLQARNA